MVDKKFIAYEGEELAIEWYFDQNDKSEAKNYFEELTPEQKRKTLHLFRLLGDTGKIFNKQKFCSEDDQIYVFKPSPDRFLCFFFEGGKVIITNAYKKQGDKLPSKEKEKALKAKAE